MILIMYTIFQRRQTSDYFSMHLYVGPLHKSPIYTISLLPPPTPLSVDQAYLGVEEKGIMFQINEFMTSSNFAYNSLHDHMGYSITDKPLQISKTFHMSKIKIPITRTVCVTNILSIVESNSSDPRRVLLEIYFVNIDKQSTCQSFKCIPIDK